MVGKKRLTEMARKWQKLVALERRSTDYGCISATTVARKGDIFTYSVDGRRFVTPPQYLNIKIFRAPFRISEKEFGLHSDGLITLPYDAADMEHIMSFLQYKICGDVEVEIRADLKSITNDLCSTSWPGHEHCQKHQIIYGF